MKATVTLELHDENEVRGLTQFMAEVEAYRNPAKALQAAAQQAAAQEAGVAQDAQQPAAEQQPEQVIATITPEKTVKAPKTGELNAAALAYIKEKGMDAALQLLGKYGAQKITEIKDPAKLVELYAELQAGVK